MYLLLTSMSQEKKITIEKIGLNTCWNNFSILFTDVGPNPGGRSHFHYFFHQYVSSILINTTRKYDLHLYYILLTSVEKSYKYYLSKVLILAQSLLPFAQAFYVDKRKKACALTNKLIRIIYWHLWHNKKKVYDSRKWFEYLLKKLFYLVHRCNFFYYWTMS